MSATPESSASAARTPAPAKSGVVIPHRAKWQQRLAARLIWLFVRGMAATIRFRLEDRSGYFSSPPKEALIFAAWHNRLALSLMLYEYYVRRPQPHRKLTCLVSASKDGGLLARVMELFNVEPTRGSSSRRGAQALRELVALGDRGYDIAITPDGPRGPCYVVRDGVIATAQLTGNDHRARVISSELEAPAQELGSVSTPATVRHLPDHHRAGHAGAARSH
jgi:lysophospholipid acyltransferase (LPLAT)-like uncharacterized protein